MQLSALTSTFNTMLFDLDPSDPTGTMVISVIILVYEWLGGLESVAWTGDSKSSSSLSLA